jgi:hypothetical protein
LMTDKQFDFFFSELRFSISYIGCNDADTQ